MKKTFKIGTRNVGWLEDKVFRKVCRGSVHIHRVTNSWAIDYDILHQLPPDGEIRIKDEEDGTIYITSVERMKRGQVLRFKNGDRDFKAQVFWPLPMWDTIKNGVREDSQDAKDQDAQLKWFDELPIVIPELVSPAKRRVIPTKRGRKIR